MNDLSFDDDKDAELLTYDKIIELVRIGKTDMLRQCFVFISAGDRKLGEMIFNVIISKLSEEESKAACLSFEDFPLLIARSETELDGALAKAYKESKQRALCAATALYTIKLYLLNFPAEQKFNDMYELPLEKLSSRKFNNEFTSRISDGLIGCLLGAGDLLYYGVANPSVFDSIPSNIALKFFRPSDFRGKTISQMLADADKRLGLAPELLDVLRVWMFSFWYQIQTPHHTDFCDNFYIQWHHWGQPSALKLLLTKTREGLHKRRPVLCHIGKFAWVVHDNELGSFALDDSVSAICTWISIVKQVYEGKDEFNNDINHLLDKK